MVHKKYIKIGKKTYGPYYYESYREDGKIKKRYYKVPDNSRRVKSYFWLGFFILIIGVLILFTFFNFFDINFFQDVPGDVLLAPYGPSIGIDGNSALTIYDDSDLDDINN